MNRKRLGVIVNPIAGMGGKVGLKGTDSLEILGKARALGATPVSPRRAVTALKKVVPVGGAVEIVTYPHEMGEDEAKECGLKPTVIGAIRTGDTRPADTKNAARDMLRSRVDLLLFAGGDGTARDVWDVVGDRIPILGIPTGVKMHSAVYATSPENAGHLTAVFLGDDSTKFRLRDAEVMDIDEQAFRENRLSAKLYGYARIPYQRTLVQSAKAAPLPGDEAALDAVCRHVANHIENNWLYIVGPGTTTRGILEKLGLKGTLLGVDAVYDRKLVGSDLNENQLLELMEGKRTRIVVTIIGGQGYVFGRGNQQISAEVIKRVGRENIMVVTTMNKIFSLEGNPLLVDTGDDEIDKMLSGYIRVMTGPNQSTILRIAS